jgi:hypothetical protein
MINVQWLLQSNHPNLPGIGEIAAILRDQGCDVHAVALKGHSAEIPDTGTLDLSRPVVCYGPSFVPRALKYRELSPGISFDTGMFRWSAFHEGWGDLMISADAVVTDTAAAVSRLGSRTMFVRPDEDSKAFDGGLFDAGSLNAVVAQAIEKGHINAGTPVVVAEAVPIDMEWRIFVVGRQVVAASSYRKDGVGNINLSVPYRVVDLAFEAADRWAPAEVFCLDIARSGDRYGIVEANCFNASRFYGADAIAILGSVSSLASRMFEAKEVSEQLPILPPEPPAAP